MIYKIDGYYSDGSMCIYGYTDAGVKAALFKGYPRGDIVTLYPHKILTATTESIQKEKIHIRSIKRI